MNASQSEVDAAFEVLADRGFLVTFDDVEAALEAAEAAKAKEARELVSRYMAAREQAKEA